MSKPSQHPGTTRREFLTDVALASAAVAGGLSLPDAATAALHKPVDRPHKLDLGVRPAANVPGAVLLPLEFASFVIFPAVKQDEDGNDYGVGTAVIEIKKYCTSSFSYPGDDNDEDRPPYFGDLDNGVIYEVEGSTWLSQVEQRARHSIPRRRITMVVPTAPVELDATVKEVAVKHVAVKSKAKPAPPRKIAVDIPAHHFPEPGRHSKHFTITFRGTTFHTIADSLDAEIREESLAEILADLHRIGAGD